MCWTLPKENRYPTATKTRDLKSAILADRKGIADKGRLTDSNKHFAKSCWYDNQTKLQ